MRRLAAILAADVVGYSRLMGRDEAGTLARLRAHRSERLEPALVRHGGRLVKLTGDGALAEFPSAVAALSAAIEFQQAMREANAGQPEDTAMVFRIGIHIGDLIVDGDDLYGDGVNVAARLEAEAPAGGIVISGAVRELVDGRLAASFEDLGDLTLKNIERPVRASRAVWQPGDWDATHVSVARVEAPALPLPDRPSIAVLPFASMGGDPDQEHFADGITEDIVTELSRFRSLFVIAHASTAGWKGQKVDARAVARELGVRYVLEGSCRCAGSRVRVTAHLVEPVAGAHLWRERYDRILDDVFEVQEDITRHIVAAIAPEVETQEAVRLQRVRPRRPQAWQLAIRAAFEAYEAYRLGSPEICNRALDLAREALVLDPDYAPAWTTVAYVYWQRIFYRFATSIRDELDSGLEAARRAIDIDRNEHRAYLARGLIYVARGEHDAAMADLRRAHELNPNDPAVLQSLGFGELMYGNLDEAERNVLEAMRLNPRDPTVFNARSILCNICFAKGDYGKGIEWGRLSLQDRPDFAPTHHSLMKNYVGAGDLANARLAAEFLRQNAPEWVARSASAFRLPEHRERDVRFRRIALDQVES